MLSAGCGEDVRRLVRRRELGRRSGAGRRGCGTILILDLNGKAVKVKRAVLGGVKLAPGEYAADNEAVSGFVADSGGGRYASCRERRTFGRGEVKTRHTETVHLLEWAHCLKDEFIFPD